MHDCVLVSDAQDFQGTLSNLFVSWSQAYSLNYMDLGEVIRQGPEQRFLCVFCCRDIVVSLITHIHFMSCLFL